MSPATRLQRLDRSPQRQELPNLRAACAVLVAFATVWIPAASTSGLVRTLVYGLGTLVFAALFPGLLAILLPVSAPQPRGSGPAPARSV